MSRNLLSSLLRRRMPAAHRLPEGVRVYAIGDVHGRLDRLRAVEQAIAEDAAGVAPGTAAQGVFRPMAGWPRWRATR